jgi:predicted secreted acid phosphatase
LQSASDKNTSNSLLWTAAWKQSAAENFALCHQAYNLARLRVENALLRRFVGGKSLAVITDMDDTIMHARSCWGHLIREGKEFFDDLIWDEWLPHNKITVAPGTKSFFDLCHDNQVTILRNQSRPRRTNLRIRVSPVAVS